MMLLLAGTVAVPRRLQPPGGGSGGGGSSGGGSGGTTCSSNIASIGMTPSVGACNTFTQGVVTAYPAGFTVLNSITHYECPTSGKRIIRANGIPDHEVTQNNPMSACAAYPRHLRRPIATAIHSSTARYWCVRCTINWQYEMPLTPTPGTALTEPMGLGVIGVAANGVPIYGAQEGGGTNAVEPTGSITDAQYWWGHAATAGLHVTRAIGCRRR